MNSYNPQRAHPFSIIYIMKRASTHDKHDIHNISTTRFPTKTGIPPRNRTRTMCNKYTTSLQTVHIFNDPQTVDQTERAVQAQWCSLNSWMHKTRETLSKHVEIKRERSLNKTRRARLPKGIINMHNTLMKWSPFSLKQIFKTSLYLNFKTSTHWY